MKLTFLGATETVTGSKYLVEHGNRRVLVDCLQGTKNLRLRNWARCRSHPTRSTRSCSRTRTSTIPAICRCWRVPRAGVLHGGHGRTLRHCATARLQEEEADFANRHGY